MSVSPQAQSVLDRLEAGECVSATSGAVTLGPLDEPTRLLLRVLMAHRRDLDQRKGGDQAEALRKFYASEKKACTPSETERDAAAFGEAKEPDIGDEATAPGELDESAGIATPPPGRSDPNGACGASRANPFAAWPPLARSYRSRSRVNPL